MPESNLHILPLVCSAFYRSSFPRNYKLFTQEKKQVACSLTIEDKAGDFFKTENWLPLQASWKTH